MTAPTIQHIHCSSVTLAEPCRDCKRRMHRGRRPRKCCDGHPPHASHGLCSRCRSARRYAATRSPLRRCWRRDDLLADWDALRGTVTFRDFPQRVGLTYSAWERAFLRARAAGDERAVRP